MKAQLLWFAVFISLGCSSSSSDSTPGDASTAKDTGDDKPMPPAASCVKAGDKGNDKGIGSPCTPLGKECDAFPGAPVCLADVGQDQWMCTRIGCTDDTQCGADATCYKDKGGSACVPNRCLDSKDDAGAETSSDAGGETSSSDAAEAG